MTFEDWYLKEIGVTVADAEARNVYDLGIMRKCWADSGAAERERCAQYLRDAAEMLAPEGRRTNQVDRHTARVLATKGDEMAARHCTPQEQP